MTMKSYAEQQSVENLVKPQKRKFVMMPILDGYIMKEFLTVFFILMFAFTLLFIIMDVYTQISDFLDNNASVTQTVRYFALKLPGNIRFILPITILLGCMYTLANFGRHREITAMRASGISLSRCGVPLFFVALLVMFANFYLNEELVPSSSLEASDLLNSITKPGLVAHQNARLQYHSGDKLRSWYFGQFNDDGFQERVKLKIFERIPETKSSFVLKKVIEAKKTRYVEDIGWEFYDAEIREYVPGGLPSEMMPAETNPLIIASDEVPDTPDIIVKSIVQPDALSSYEIYHLLKDNPFMAHNLKNIYKTLFYHRLAFPWACFICAILALPLAARNERSGIFTSIAIAVGLAVFYQVFDEILMLAGKNGLIPPVVAGVLPTALFFLYGLHLIRKAG